MTAGKIASVTPDWRGDTLTAAATGSRSVDSVATTDTSADITAPADSFTVADVGRTISATGIPADTTLVAVASDTAATMSASATATGSVTATLTGDTVLAVKDATDFDEEEGPDARLLVIGESEPLEYVAVDHDANTITLAAPAAADYEAGLPVLVWDPTVDGDGAAVVEHKAEVTTDRGPVYVTLPHEKIPFAGVDLLVGASVTLAEDEAGEWYVDQIHGRTPRASVAGSFATDTGYDDIEIIPGDDDTPAALRFMSDGPFYDLDDPAGISCFDEPGFGDPGSTDFYVQFLGARALDTGVLARPRIRLFTSYTLQEGFDPGVVSSVDLISGGSSDDLGFVRMIVKNTLIAIANANEFQVLEHFVASKHVRFDDLATTGGSIDAGARYCRVGDDGRLYASENPPASLTDELDAIRARLDALEGP